jgi:hypothetical protein
MIDYTNKYKHYPALVEDYRPLSFKFMGYSRKERLPHWASLLRPASFMAQHIKSALSWEVSYFDLRPSMTPEQRKKGDLQFLTHFAKSHDRGAENVSRSERVRYYWLKIRYLPEIMHINGQMWDKDGEPIVDLPESIDMYLLRWGYLLSVPPDFVELIHGTEACYAKALAADML